MLQFEIGVTSLIQCNIGPIATSRSMQALLCSDLIQFSDPCRALSEAVHTFSQIIGAILLYQKPGGFVATSKLIVPY